MKLLISLFLLFGYIYAQDCDYTDVCGESNGKECTDKLCEDIDPDCKASADASYCELDPLIVPGSTLEAADCDDDQDENNWTVEYIGKSTQWRIIDPCDGKKITFKMEDLTEYAATGKKTVFKETSFASIKDWQQENTQNDEKITNIFVADALTKVDASFSLITDFYRTEVEITDPNDVNSTIMVDKNNFKYSVNITNWQLAAEDNYLELCVTIKTNSKDAFNRDGKEVGNGEYTIDNPQQFRCGDAWEDGDGNDFGVEMTDSGNGKNQLRLCYKFDSCNGDIFYDPLITMNPDAGNYMSVFVVGVFSIMSLIFV